MINMMYYFKGLVTIGVLVRDFMITCPAVLRLACMQLADVIDWMFLLSP